MQTGKKTIVVTEKTHDDLDRLRTRGSDTFEDIIAELIKEHGRIRKEMNKADV